MLFYPFILLGYGERSTLLPLVLWDFLHMTEGGMLKLISGGFVVSLPAVSGPSVFPGSFSLGSK